MLFSIKNLIRFMLLLIILLAFAAGFYESSFDVESKKNKILENKIKILENKTIGIGF
jgi:hypothetical protein